MLISSDQIQKDLGLEPLRPFPALLPADPFERLSLILGCFFPPCHPDLAFLIRLFVATHYHIIDPSEILEYWKDRSTLTQNNPFWDLMPASINWYLPSLPPPNILQLVIILRSSYQYSRKRVDPKVFFSYLSYQASTRTPPLTDIDITLLKFLEDTPMASLPQIAKELNTSKKNAAEILRKLRKSHGVNIYNKIHYQNIGLDNLFILIPIRNIHYSSSFPSYSIPYFGETHGTQIGLRVPVGLDSIWVQKQFVALAKRLKTSVQIYRTIDHAIFINYDTYSRKTSLWGSHQPINQKDKLKEIEKWSPRGIKRKPLTELEFTILANHIFGIPIGGNRDSSHPLLDVLKQKGYTIGSMGVFRVIQELIAEDICTPFIRPYLVDIDRAYTMIIFEDVTVQDISKIFNWFKNFPLVFTIILEKAWPGTTLGHYSLAARIGVSNNYLLDYLDAEKIPVKCKYTIRFVEIAVGVSELPPISNYDFKNQKWIFPRNQVELSFLP